MFLIVLLVVKFLLLGTEDTFLLAASDWPQREPTIKHERQRDPEAAHPKTKCGPLYSFCCAMNKRRVS
jgi:hypothetical protein